MSGNRGDLSECLGAPIFPYGLLRLTAACTYASPVEYEFRAEIIGAGTPCCGRTHGCTPQA